MIRHQTQVQLTQDFGATIRRSGRMLLITDAIALFLAYIAGGLIARGVNVMLKGGFQNLGWLPHR